MNSSEANELTVGQFTFREDRHAKQIDASPAWVALRFEPQSNVCPGRDRWVERHRDGLAFVIPRHCPQERAPPLANPRR